MNLICESCRLRVARWTITFSQRAGEPVGEPFHVCDDCLVVDDESEIEEIQGAFHV